MHSEGVGLDSVCRESVTVAFSAIRLKLVFSVISYCTFNTEHNNSISILLISNMFCVSTFKMQNIHTNNYKLVFKNCFLFST